MRSLSKAPDRSEFYGHLSGPLRSSCFTCGHRPRGDRDLPHQTGSPRRTGGAIVVVVSQVDGRVQVSLDGQAAGLAAEDPLVQRHLLLDATAPGTHLRRWIVPRCDDQPRPVPLRLVLELAAHLVRSGPVDGAREAVVPGHIGRCQVLDHDYRFGSRQHRGELVQPVQADVRDPAPYFLVPDEGPEAVLAPLRLPGEGLLGVPLLPLQPLQPRPLEGGAVAHCRRVDDAPVDTGYRAVVDLPDWDPLLPDAYGDEPPPRPLGDCGVQDVAPREGSSLLQLDPAEGGQTDCPILDVDRAGKGERLSCSMPALERRPAEAVSADQEVVEGAPQVPARLLRCALRDLVHPGIVLCLPRVEDSVLVDRRLVLQGRVRKLVPYVDVVVPLEAPIVGEAGDAARLCEKLSLGLRGSQLCLVAHCYQGHARRAAEELV